MKNNHFVQTEIKRLYILNATLTCIIWEHHSFFDMTSGSHTGCQLVHTKLSIQWPKVADHLKMVKVTCCLQIDYSIQNKTTLGSGRGKEALGGCRTPRAPWKGSYYEDTPGPRQAQARGYGQEGGNCGVVRGGGILSPREGLGGEQGFEKKHEEDKAQRDQNVHKAGHDLTLPNSVVLEGQGQGGAEALVVSHFELNWA